MTRTRVIISVAAVLLAVLPVGGAASAQAKRYSAIDVEAYYHYIVDRGDNVELGIAGEFRWIARYRMRTIAVFDGARVGTPGRLGVVAARLTVQDTRKKQVLVSGQWRVVPYCDGWDPDFGLDVQRAGSLEYVAAPSASASIGATSRLLIKPGTPARFRLKYCSDSETLNTHSLPAGPDFSLPAPAKARFRGTKPFSIICSKSAFHDAEHGVESFFGSAQVKVSIRPFPASALENRQALLRGMIGDEYRPALPGDLSGQSCLR